MNAMLQQFFMTPTFRYSILAANDKKAGSASLDEWRRKFDAEEIKSLFQDWPPHLKRAVNEVRQLADFLQVT